MVLLSLTSLAVGSVRDRSLPRVIVQQDRAVQQRFYIYGVTSMTNLMMKNASGFAYRCVGLDYVLLHIIAAI